MANPEEEPLETDQSFFVRSECWSLSQIISRAKTKWGNHIEVADITFGAVHFHAYHITHDQYDSSDYVNYVEVMKP